MSKPDKWDLRYLGLCAYIAQWSKDPSTKVGAVIVDHKNRIVSQGFNGFPRGVKDLHRRYNNRETKLNMVIHAEENALIFAQRSVEGCTAYVWPLPPCSNCAAKLIQAGISRVVSRTPNPNSKWKESIERSISMFEEAGVEVFFINRSDA